MEKEFRSFAVNIEKSENDMQKGWFMNPYIQEYITFRDLGEMVVKMDECMHHLIEKEEQGELICCHSFRDVVFQSKPRFFYLIQILYTQHHSWQGLVAGTNRPRITFRSTLDCIRIMDQAIQGKQSRKKHA